MLLGKKFEAFIEQSPVSVMVRGTLERILHPDILEELFQKHALVQYTLKITFAQCVQIMNAVVFNTQPSPGAWFKVPAAELPPTPQPMSDQLQNDDPPLPR